MKSSLKKTLMFTLTLLALIFSIVGIIPASAAPAKIAPAAESPSLLQFSSSGHILGFSVDGMYAATGSHALHVDFVNANRVQPQSVPPASTDGAAAPLSQVTYANLWDGVTLTYNASGIYTTTYTVAAGADVKNIQLKYNAPLTLNRDGSLSIAFETGALTESAPIAWQNINDKRVAVEVAYQIRGQEVAFKVGTYNPNYALMIDPTLTWNTFLGGSGSDIGTAIAVDGSGNVYVAGGSDTTWGTPVLADNAGNNAFAAKLNSSGVLQWNTFLGGSGSDVATAIAVDGSGNVYMAGFSTATWGAPVRAYSASNDAFAAQLNSSGVLQWNTFLGGSGSDGGYSIAVDGSGNVYVAGTSNATWSAPVRAYSGGTDAFAAQLNSSGVLQWNTFLGGSVTDQGYSIAVDGNGNVYVAGNSSTTWGAPVQAYSSGGDAFAAQLNSTSGMLQWNTFLGGSGYDVGTSIVVDGSDNVYMAGTSNATWGAPVRAYSAANDAFAVQLDSSGVLQWNTFLGGSGYDVGTSIVVDGSDNVYMAGTSNATWGAPVRAYSAANDAFAVQLDSSGGLQWNTFLGGSEADDGNSIAVDGSGNVYVAGDSSATWGAPVQAYSASSDAFVAVLSSTYTVTFDANGGSGSMSPQVASSATALTSNAFTRAGYTFAGWNTVALGGGTAYANGASYPFTADVTLYAQWTVATYTVTFDKDGGTGTTDPITGVAYNATVTLPTNPTKLGNNFGGWYTAINGGGTQFTAATPVTANITVYAKWTNVVVTPIFTDVPLNHWANSYITILYNAGITSGCGAGIYCPDGEVTRAQLAVFLLKSMHGSSYAPPAVGVSTGFGDVATNYWAAAWIKQLAAEGITSGCGNGNYCPDQTVTRAQMAVFLLKARNGSSYSPPAVGASTGFNDVATNYWAAAFIKQLVADSITSGCGSNNYCPDSNVTRAQMAVFLVKTFNLP